MLDVKALIRSSKLENFTPISAMIGGVLIGISAVLFMLLNGRIAGISGIIAGVLVPGGDRADRYQRVAFITGLFIAPFLVWLVAARPAVDFPQPLWMVVIGGFLVGFGTRLGGGCTSGHGVCGIARFSKRSIVATLTFMVSAMITVFVIGQFYG